MGADELLNGLWPLGLGDEAVIGDFSYMYGYHESTEELKHKLLYTSMELESQRSRMSEEMRRKEEEMAMKDESINQLTQQVKMATQERDEARLQLQTLLNEITTPRAGSSLTESDSLKSFVSSPIESFNSPIDLTNINIADPEFFGQCKSSATWEDDQGSRIIEYLAMKRGLPEKGKLMGALQAVMRSTPMLQTLLTTGPLPQFMNPPPVQLWPMPLVRMPLNSSAVMNPSPTSAEIGTGSCQRSTRKRQLA